MARKDRKDQSEEGRGAEGGRSISWKDQSAAAQVGPLHHRCIDGASQHERCVDAASTRHRRDVVGASPPPQPPQQPPPPPPSPSRRVVATTTILSRRVSRMPAGPLEWLGTSGHAQGVSRCSSTTVGRCDPPISASESTSTTHRIRSACVCPPYGTAASAPHACGTAGTKMLFGP